MFSCEYCKIFKNTFFKEHLLWLFLENICMYVYGPTGTIHKAAFNVTKKIHEQLCTFSIKVGQLFLKASSRN